MKLFVLAALALVAVSGVSAFSGIEISSQIGHASAPPSMAGGRLSLSDPCAMTCALQASQCNDDCAFSAVNDAEDMACRAECGKDTTRCVTKCVIQERRAAAAAKDGRRTSPRTDTFQQTPPPRPPSMNAGFGPESVKNFAGYITVNGTTPAVKRHLWSWTFESRNDPTTDPLVIWLTGGPGCSSLVALFAENGPYIIADDLSLSLNPNSWNSNATVIWIDQPVNTGYSFGDSGDLGVFSEAQVAENLYEFIQNFLAEYPQYAQLPFFITGESYAGHYIPAFASRVLQGNQDPAWPKINLQAIAIGNGLVDPLIQYAEYAPFAAATKSVPASSLATMEAGIPGCVAAIQACAQNSTLGLEACILATETCNLSQMMPFQLTGLNVYDVRIKCAVPPLCYNFSNVDTFLAQPEVQAALGVTDRTWQDCNRLVDLALVFAGDWMLNLAAEVPAILASGVRVVVYSGEYDFICNWYGGNAWTNALEWPGQQSFNTATNTTWIVDGAEAGSSRTAQGFTFVRVKDAGHMVPLNQPVNALDLLARVISGASFDASPAYVEDNSAPTQEPSIAIE